ncbi:diguanylate cyclase domain-containing protein [Noviherbaspirillum pedocola]|uniref:Diguanylate cyclase n=1 Tax=Noviherbaspirillum pedocola TaxID=2801341 RepID=A0A934W7S2_9BURK|nr:diguanylate cyclase [Noviherbaspirillum pedocola]MBK4735943.1 diguanylate cyclase [Noviherbaspirillum pedocola]
MTISLDRVFSALGRFSGNALREPATLPGPAVDDGVSRLFPYPLGRAILARLYAFVAMLLGVTVGIGWIMAADPLVRLIPDTALMNANVSALMALSGLSLCLGCGRIAVAIRKVAGAVLLIWATLLFLQNFCSVDFVRGWPLVHGHGLGSGSAPGQVAPTSCVAFFLIGYVLQRIDALYGAAHAARLRLAIGMLFAVCAVGFAGYFLDLNLLYSWYRVSRMALATAIGVTLLTVSLTYSYQVRDWSDRRDASREGSRIVSTGIVLMLIIGTSAGLTGFVMFLHYQKTSVSGQLQSVATSRAQMVEATIGDALSHGRYVVGRAALMAQVRDLAARANDRAAQSRMQQSLAALLAEGFTSASVMDRAGRILAQAGAAATRPYTDIPVKSELPSRLLWSNGFLIETDAPVYDRSQHQVATLVMQRRFSALSSFFMDLSATGASADTALCGRAASGRTTCFPASPLRQEQEYLALNRHGRIAVEEAIDGMTAVRMVRDYRDEQVLAAITPVDDSGLGMIIKVDAAEVFAPIRALLERTAMTLAGLLLIGAYVLRKLIRPLVRRIIDSERRAREANALALEREMRSRTVVDHVFDGIISMDANGVLLSCNPAACSMFGYTQEQLIGQHFSLLLPKRHRNAARAFFAAYQDPDFPSSIKTHKIKLRGARQGGSEFHFEFGTNEVMLSGHRGYVGILHDVTESYEARRALAKSENMLRTVTNNLPALVRYVDRREIVRFANGTHEEWFEKPISEIVGYTLRDLLGASYEHAHPFAQQALAGQNVQFEERFLHVHDSAARHTMTTYIPDFDFSGNVAGFYVLASDITERKAHEEALRHLAYHDTLTDLPNRRLFHDRLDQAMARSQRRHTMMALCYLDIDHFKSINDTLGHDNGDVLLKEFANRLSAAVRATDTVARLGGDEFTVIMEDLALAADAEHVAVKILDAVGRPVTLGQACLKVTTSIGIALYNGEDVSRNTVIKVSDEALYCSKQRGRDTHTLVAVAPQAEHNRQLALLEVDGKPAAGPSPSAAG